jgi:type III pantothenate kinase
MKPHGVKLLLDIGNTTIKAGAFKNNQLDEVRSFLLADGLLAWIKDKKPDLIATGSVGNSAWLSVIKNTGIKLIELHSALRMPFVNHYRSTSLGIDRAAAAAGVKKLWPGKNFLAIDMGTCITYDIIDYKGHYFGGAISPGMKMRFKAMQTFTNRLPMVYENDYDGAIGLNTETCMAAGVIEGICAEVERFIATVEAKYSPLFVVITGGDAAFFEKKINRSIFAFPNLVLVGLNEILELNYPDEL